LAEAVLDVLLDGLRLIQHRLLHEDADGGLRIEEGLAVGGLVESGHDLEDRGLTGAVRPHDADLCTGVEGHCDVVEDHLVPVRLANLLHGVNKLGHSTLSPAETHLIAAGGPRARPLCYVPTRGPGSRGG